MSNLLQAIRAGVRGLAPRAGADDGNETEKPEAVAPEDAPEDVPEDDPETAPDENNPDGEPAGDEAEASPDDADPADEEKPAALAERTRIAAILTAPAAAANMALAQHLAFNTGDSAEKALAALNASAGGRTLAARMAANPQPKLGQGNGAANTAANIETRIPAALAAMKTRRRGGQKGA